MNVLNNDTRDGNVTTHFLCTQSLECFETLYPFVMSKLNIIEMQNNDGGEDHEKAKQEVNKICSRYLSGAL